MVKGKTKSRKGLESLLRYTPKKFRGFLESAWKAKKYVEAGQVSEAAKTMADYVDDSAVKICATVRSPAFTIGLYRATIYAAKIAGAMYGSLVGLAANELVEYLEKEIEEIEKVAEKKIPGQEEEEDLEGNLMTHDMSYNMDSITVAA